MFISKSKFNQLALKVEEFDNRFEKTAPLESFEGEKGKRAAYALNLCMVSVSQIVDYSDIYILEQEYDAILNNLNLQEFPKDEPLLKVLKEILDTVTFFRIQEGDKKFIEKEYQHKMKNAIWSAIPNPTVILSGGHPAAIAINLVTQIGIGYMNYRKNKSQYVLEKEKQEWELERSAIDQFNALRRDLFETAWRLSDTYNFKDALRLTEKQINQYNSMIIDPISLRRYERLDSVSKDFGAFPPFWYHKGNAAREIFIEKEFGEDSIKFKEYALEDFRKFNEIHIPLMREDVLAASCAMEHISLLDVTENRPEIENLLKKAISLAGNNFDILQMCVLVYSSIGKIEDATQILQRLINENYNIEMNGPFLSRIYCKYENDELKYNILAKRIGDINVLPWNKDGSEEEIGDLYRENKEKYKERFHQIVRGFDLFLDEFASEYLTDFITEYEREDKSIDKIMFFRDKDLYLIVTDNLNEMFSQLYKFFGSDLKTWSDSLFNIASGASIQLNKFKLSYKEVCDFISERSRGKGKQPRLHFHREDHPQNQEVCEKIEDLFKEMKEVHSCVLEEMKLRFKHGISMKVIAEHGDNIKKAIEDWYKKHYKSLPLIESIKDTTTDNTLKLFFSND